MSYESPVLDVPTSCSAVLTSSSTSAGYFNNEKVNAWNPQQVSSDESIGDFLCSGLIDEVTWQSTDVMTDPEILKRGRGGWTTMYQPRRRLSQMHATNYMPFIREKAAYCQKKNSEPLGGQQTPLNSPLHWSANNRRTAGMERSSADAGMSRRITLMITSTKSKYRLKNII